MNVYVTSSRRMAPTGGESPHMQVIVSQLLEIELVIRSKFGVKDGSLLWTHCSSAMLIVSVDRID